MKLLASFALLVILAAETCAQFSSTGVANILKAHNTLRSSIAQGTYVAKGTKKPKATNMVALTWNDTIAMSAQGYAEQCPDGHSNYPNLGENLFWSWTNDENIDLDPFGVDASNSWEKEFQDNGWSKNTFDMKLFNTHVGHATQEVWAKTSQIGCGVSNCPDPQYNAKITVVCQYYPQGNYLNQDIYESGPATCSNCPSPSTCQLSSGLCV